MERTSLRLGETPRALLPDVVAERLDHLLSFLGILFVLVVVGDTIVGDESPWDVIFGVAGWVIWAVFAVEFATRLLIAPSRLEFLRKNWWQALFLVLPFLRFLRLVTAVRLGRAGRVVSSAVRGGRTAAGQLRSRLGWLVAITILVILAAAQLLFEFGRFARFTDALHAAALGAVTGEPTRVDNGIAQVIDVVLALYSVVVFAAVAGMLSAFLLRRDEEEPHV